MAKQLNYLANTSVPEILGKSAVSSDILSPLKL